MRCIHWWGMNLLKGPLPPVIIIGFWPEGLPPRCNFSFAVAWGGYGFRADFSRFLQFSWSQKKIEKLHYPTSPHITPHHPTPPRITPHYPTAPKTSPKHHPTPKNHPENIQKHHPKHRLKQSWFSQPVDCARMQYQGEWVSFVEEKVIENNPKAGVPCPTLGVLGG